MIWTLLSRQLTFSLFFGSSRCFSFPSQPLLFVLMILKNLLMRVVLMILKNLLMMVVLMILKNLLMRGEGKRKIALEKHDEKKAGNEDIMKNLSHKYQELLL